MTPRPSLRRRLLLGLLGYVALLSLAVVVHGVFVNEHAERLVWDTLLRFELAQFEHGERRNPGFEWVDTPAIRLYDGRDPARLPPPALRGLAPGLHDEVALGAGEHVVLVRNIAGRPVMLALDITALEARERDMALTVAGSALLMLLLLGLVAAWGVNRLLRPLSELALRIGRLSPDQPGRRIVVPDPASHELETIAAAFNDYLQRNQGFVERERAFIDSASHELRTPIAVIAGASELALNQVGVPDSTRQQLFRIQRTARDVEQLVSLLLVLAKDPTRLAQASDTVALDQLLPEIVEDHRHLSLHKDLQLQLEPLPACEIVAPVPIVQAAIGNLLRNAIENSDRGTITIRLEPDATVVIEDPGHGMTPEEISTLYTRMARGGSRDGGGIGLALISRLCEHLQWQLEFSARAQRGTITTLRLRGAAPAH